MNRDRYTAHAPRRSDIRGSLERHVGTTATTEAEIDAMARRAYRDGIIVFTRRMLERMKPYERAVLEGLARNFLGGA